MRIEQRKPRSGNRIVLYGSEGVGKSTWAASAKGAVFVDVEDGTGYLDPLPQAVLPDGTWTWPAVLAAIDAVLESPAQVLVLDTLDAIEPLIHQHICQRDGKQDVEAYGYGKGYTVALGEWRKLLASLDRFRAAGKDVVLLAHAVIRRFDDPAGEGFDRYELAIRKDAAGVVKQWADFLLFAHFQHVVEKKGAKAKGIGGSQRVLSTERCAAWDAKARRALPATLAMSWSDFAAELAADDSEALRAEILERAAALDDKKALAWAEKNLKTAPRATLAEAANRLRVKAQGKE